MTTYIGIDPGKSGALAIIRNEEIKVYPYDEDTYKDVLKKCSSLGSTFCILEKVGAMPHQGVTSMFNFGKNFGFIQGLLWANGIPYELVTPQKWKKEFGCTKDKNTSIEVAKRLYPKVSFKRTERCTTDSDGMAEALLMATYGMRRVRRGDFS